MTNLFAQEFYDRPADKVAYDLVGALLTSVIAGQETCGRIVETEAYLSAGDQACHAAIGKTARNSMMFEEPGVSYVYSIHTHCCFNVVTEPAGVGSAVLIRAVEPVYGLEFLEERRGGRQWGRLLTAGPGRLCRAMGISLEHSGLRIFKFGELFIHSDSFYNKSKFKINASARIGISKSQNLPLRFYIPLNPYVSGKKSLRT